MISKPSRNFASFFLHIATVAAILAVYLPSSAQENHYRIFSLRLQKEVPADSIIADMENHNVLLFGEEHNDSAGHALEKELLSLLFLKYGTHTVLSMEMFDRDVQNIMEEYLSGLIREKDFRKDVRPWKNYTDYRPLVEFCKENGIRILCSNAPSRYVNAAGRMGQEKLMQIPQISRKFIAPLPYDTATGKYYEQLIALSGHASSPKKDSAAITSNPSAAFNIVQAQSLWDATMAYSITEFYRKNKKSKILHINGKLHSDEEAGIMPYLKKRNSKLKALVISCFPDESFSSPSWTKFSSSMADYIIITDPGAGRTF